MSEKQRQSEVMEDFEGVDGVQLFRNNNGQASWQGRVVRFGLQNGEFRTGTSDLIGWYEVEITEDMVGKTVAVFTAIEMKADESKKATVDQAAFIEAVRAAGGFAGVAWDVESAWAIVEGGLSE